MKKVIALYSFPQECGDDSLRFISCEDGQVILDINLTMEEDPYEKKVTREILSEIEIFYDLCAKQRYEVFESVRRIPNAMGSFADAKCTKKLHESPKEFWKKYKRESLTILSCSKGRRVHSCWCGDLDKKGIKAYSWKYTVAKTKTTTEYIYNAQRDSVYKEIKAKTGVEAFLADNRYDKKELANKIATALNFELLNILFS